MCRRGAVLPSLRRTGLWKPWLQQRWPAPRRPQRGRLTAHSTAVKPAQQWQPAAPPAARSRSRAAHAGTACLARRNAAMVRTALRSQVNSVSWHKSARRPLLARRHISGAQVMAPTAADASPRVSADASTTLRPLVSRTRSGFWLHYDLWTSTTSTPPTRTAPLGCPRNKGGGTPASGHLICNWKRAPVWSVGSSGLGFIDNISRC